jgi:eukaryotic-like serine/threonine-protein kinase
LFKQMKSIKLITSLGLLLLVAAFLTACGAVPANNFAGLSTDGTNLYVANSSYVSVVNPATGTVSWKFPAKPDQNITFFGAPAVADGWLYAGDYKNVAFGFALQGIDPGNPLPTWTYKEQEGKGRFIGAPTIAGDLVLFPSTDHHLYALDRKAGTLRWRFKTRDTLWAPAASDGKLIYQPGLDHYLYALDLAQGSLRWEVDLGGPMVGGLTFGQDGQLYVGTLNQELVAVEAATGKILWRKTTEGNTWSTLLLHEGKLYFGTDKNKVYIFSAADGQELKKADAASSVIASPVYTDGAVAFVTEGGEIFTMTLDGESRPWTRTIKGKLYSTPLVINNQVVIAPYQGDQLLAGYDFTGNLDAKWNTVTTK